jgi:transcriptional regulator with XRE-family HTH domain
MDPVAAVSLGGVESSAAIREPQFSVNAIMEPAAPLTKARPSRRRTFIEHGPNPADVHIGAQLRTARLFSGMTLAQTAAVLKVSHQAIDKYERAHMRVSAHMLWQAAHLFRKPIGYFFDGLDQDGNPAPRETHSRIEIELLVAFRSVESRELRMEVVRLLRVAATVLGNAPDQEPR